MKAALVEVRETERSGNPTRASWGELAPPLKWASVIIAGLMTAGISALIFYGAETLNDVKISVTQIQIQLGQDGAFQARFQELNRRMERLEAIHAAEDRRLER